MQPVTFMSSGGDPRFFNRNAYCYNDPINCIDPSGRNGVGLTRSDYEMMGVSTAQSQANARIGIGVIADFTPVVGSIKGGVEFINDPSAINAVGIIPYGKLLKRGKQVGDIIDPGGTTKASEIAAKAEDVGFTPSQTKNGPKNLKMKMELIE